MLKCTAFTGNEAFKQEIKNMNSYLSVSHLVYHCIHGDIALGWGKFKVAIESSNWK